MRPIASEESLKRRVYVVILLAALAGALLGLGIGAVSGLASPFIQGLLVSAAAFEAFVAWLIYSGKLRLEIIEEAMYVIPTILLLGVFSYALYAPDLSDEQSASALRGFYLWIPAVYVVVFMAHEGTGAFVRSVVVYVAVVAVSLPAAYGSISTLNLLSLDQLYISGAVVISFLYFVARMRDRLHEAEVAAERMKNLAETDSLTGLHNRRRATKILEVEIERSRRYEHPLSVIVFDVDDFKRVNDDFGHDAGDAVLEDLARLSEEILRDSDELARWGGEEFIAILPATPRGAAQTLAGRLRVAIEDEVFGFGGTISASFGVSELQRRDSATTLIKRADTALYKAKTLGKNRVEV